MPWDYLVIAAVVVVAGIVTGLLMALFGIGGGAFVVPVLDTLFARLPGIAPPPFKVAVISSLIAIGLGSARGAWQAWRTEGFERRQFGLLFAGSVPAALVGVTLVNLLSSNALRVAFAGALLALGLWTTFGRPREAKGGADRNGQHALLLGIGALSGLASALFGLGGATLLMPLLTMTAGFTALHAALVSMAFVFVASVQSLLVFGVSVATGLASTAGLHAIHLELIGLMTIAVVLAQQFFACRLHRMPDQLRRRLLGIYLIVAAAWLVRETLVR